MRFGRAFFIWVLVYGVTLSGLFGWLYLQRESDEQKLADALYELTLREAIFRNHEEIFEKVMNTTDDRISLLQKRIDAQEENQKALLDKGRDLEVQKETLANELNQSQSEVAKCNKEIAELRTQISLLNQGVGLAKIALEKEAEERSKLTKELRAKEQNFNLLNEAHKRCLQNSTALLSDMNEMMATKSICDYDSYLKKAMSLQKAAEHQTQNCTMPDNALSDKERHELENCRKNQKQQTQPQTTIAEGTNLESQMDAHIFEYAMKNPIPSSNRGWDVQLVNYTNPANDTKICLLVPLLIPEDGGHAEEGDAALKKLLEMKSQSPSDIQSISQHLRIIVVHDFILPQGRADHLASNLSIPIEFMKANWNGNLKSFSYELENEILLSNILTSWLQTSQLRKSCDYIFMDDTHGGERPSDLFQKIPEIHENLVEGKYEMVYSLIEKSNQPHLSTMASRFCAWSQIEPTYHERKDMTKSPVSEETPAFAGHIMIRTDFLLSPQVQDFLKFVDASKGIAYFKWSPYAILWMISALFAPEDAVAPLIDI